MTNIGVTEGVQAGAEKTTGKVLEKDEYASEMKIHSNYPTTRVCLAFFVFWLVFFCFLFRFSSTPKAFLKYLGMPAMDDPLYARFEI